MCVVIGVTDAGTAILDYETVNFESLVNQHKDAVYRQMIRACGNHEDAEDVLIEALFRAYRHLDQLHDTVAFRAWLARIATRVCWQLRKRDGMQPLLQLSVLQDEGRELPALEPPIDSRVELAQMKQLLTSAIASLPDGYRRVYEMRDLDNLSGAEVAGKLGISTAAMKSRLHRARTRIRQHLDEALGARS